MPARRFEGKVFNFPDSATDEQIGSFLKEWKAQKGAMPEIARPSNPILAHGTSNDISSQNSIGGDGMGADAGIGLTTGGVQERAKLAEPHLNQIKRGVGQVFPPKKLDDIPGGISNMFRGAMGTVGPEAAAIGVAAGGLPAIAGMGIGSIASPMAESLASTVLPEGTSSLIGDAAGVYSGVKGSGLPGAVSRGFNSAKTSAGKLYDSGALGQGVMAAGDVAGGVGYGLTGQWPSMIRSFGRAGGRAMDVMSKYDGPVNPPKDPGVREFTPTGFEGGRVRPTGESFKSPRLQQEAYGYRPPPEMPVKAPGAVAKPPVPQAPEPIAQPEVTAPKPIQEPTIEQPISVSPSEITDLAAQFEASLANLADIKAKLALATQNKGSGMSTEEFKTRVPGGKISRGKR